MVWRLSVGDELGVETSDGDSQVGQTDSSLGS